VIHEENVDMMTDVLTLRGHGNVIRDLEFSPDSDRLIVATGGSSARDIHRLHLWDVHTGDLIAVSDELHTITWDVAYSPDGESIVTAMGDGTVRLWGADDLTPLQSYPHAGEVNSVAISPDGRYLASGVAEPGGGFVVIQQDSAPIRRFWAHPYSVPSMDFSPTGQFLATGAVDRSVKVWQVSDGRLVETLLQDGQGTSVVFSPDGSLLASGMCALSDAQIKCLQGEIWAWNVPEWDLIRTFRGPVDWVEDVDFSPNMSLVAGGGRDFAVYVWQLRDARLIRTLAGHTGPVAAVDFSPDGTMLATGSSDETVKIWKITP
jgi:WD40 repeat protein